MMVKVSWMIKLRPRLMYSSCLQMFFKVASSATSSSGSGSCFQSLVLSMITSIPHELGRVEVRV